MKVKKVVEKRSVLDKFYTNIDVGNSLIDAYFNTKKKKDWSKYLFIEPSAGDGALLTILENHNISNVLGFDLQPERNDIVKQDFFLFDIAKYNTKQQPVIIFMNPPFGISCNLAVKFFNKASEFSKEIWQIVPKTFKKNSIKNKLNKKFHLIFEKDMPKNSFLFEGKAYDVPCCFQVWIKKAKERIIQKNNITSIYIEFTEKKNATHAIRRVGGKAGKLLEGLDHNSNSTYFVKLKNKKVIDAINNLNLKEIVNATAGVRSISKAELISLIEEKMYE